MLDSVVYIASDVRSGSTMLDLLLGNHSDIFSIGEVHHLEAYVKRDRRLYDPNHPLTCMCGERIENCHFWIETEKALGSKLINLGVSNPCKIRLTHFHDLKNLNIIKNTVFSIFNRLNLFGIERFYLTIGGEPKVPIESFRLYEAISKTAGKKYVVDSSKWPERFWQLYLYRPRAIKVIYLCRDPRAVVYSYMKRGGTVEIAVKQWVRIQKKIEHYINRLPKNQTLRIRYEDLCDCTEVEMRRVCKFLNIEFKPQMIQFDKKNKHHIGGSPSKFKKNKTIKLDKSYLCNLKNDDLKKINKISSRIRKVWRYGF